MPPVSLPEKRFKENSGVRFMADGRIRCHGLSKSKIREWRETYQDTETPTEELWPECQCGVYAEVGHYVCRFHGGKSPRTVRPPRTMLDVMPLEMAEKFKAVMDSPDYISRKDDINLIKTRIMMLLEELNQESSTEEAWGGVHEALVKLRHGDTLNAIYYLEEAVKATENKKTVWKDIYQAEKLLGELTTTQMKTAKELQSMATAEQVQALISVVINAILAGAQVYIPDPIQRNSFTLSLVSEIQKVTGTTPYKMLIDAN